MLMWEPSTQIQFEKMIGKVPIFLREMVQKKVSTRAEKIAVENAHPEVTEKDMVDAFFAETPFGFHGPMKCDMEEFGIDYQKYGHKR